MKQTMHLSGVLLFFFLLLILTSQSTRLLLGEEIKPMKMTDGVSHAEIVQEHSSMNELMGLELCENGDEECNERRMATEAHLDYIYTQKHKP